MDAIEVGSAASGVPLNGRDGGREVGQVQPDRRARRLRPLRVCTGTRADGQRCTFPPMVDSDRCFNHDERPATVARRAAARSRGGRAAAARLDLSTIEGARAALAKVAQDVRSGEVSQRKGELLVRAITTALRVHERAQATQRRHVRHVVEFASYAIRSPDGKRRKQGRRPDAGLCLLPLLVRLVVHF